jgi:hypothetical protein
MRKITFYSVLFCIIAILFTSCYRCPSRAEIANFDYGEYPTNYEQIIKGYLNEILVDPFSIKNLTITPPRKKWIQFASMRHVGYLCYASFFAKNRMGGYTGKSEYAFIINNGQVVFHEKADFFKETFGY